MKMQSKRALAVMAIILAAATAATAATALAGEKKKKAAFQPTVVAETVNTTSQAMLRAKLRLLRNTDYRISRSALAVPK